jgi:hypothetical protein
MIFSDPCRTACLRRKFGFVQAWCRYVQVQGFQLGMIVIVQGVLYVFERTTVLYCFCFFFYKWKGWQKGMTPGLRPWRAVIIRKLSEITPSMSSSPPTSPSHRSPLTLLSKLKRQLSKSPITQHQKQPIEHQYLPIPTVSFSESVHSNRALSTYSCSESSRSSFVLIDHNEQPASFGVDEYRPFLPLMQIV